jgi:hypothetical protein
MKVHELIAALNKMPAGADVVIYKNRPRDEDYDTFDIEDVNGGDITDEVIGNVYLDMGAKQ